MQQQRLTNINQDGFVLSTRQNLMQHQATASFVRGRGGGDGYAFQLRARGRGFTRGNNARGARGGNSGNRGFYPKGFSARHWF